MKKIQGKIKQAIQRFFTPPNVDDIETELENIKEKKNLKLGKLHLSTKNITIFWGMGMLFVFIGYYLFNFLNTLFIILAAYIISVIMEGLIHYFQKRHRSRGIAITVSYIVLIVITLLCVLFISPLIIDQIAGLVGIVGEKLSYLQQLFSNTPLPTIINNQSRIPEMIKTDILESLKNSSWELNTMVQNGIGKLISGITSSLGVFSNIAVQTLSMISGFIIKFLMIIFLAILFSVEKDLVSNFIISLFPKRKQQRVSLQIQRMYKYLAFWFKYRLALSIFMFAGIYLCFGILYLFGIDISHKFSLALSLAILDIIPYLWPIMAGILMFLSAITEHSFFIALLLPIFVMIVNTLENTVVVPYIMNKSMGVSLILTFVCMLLWWLVMGLLWVFLSIPFAMILTLFFQKDFIIKKE